MYSDNARPGYVSLNGSRDRAVRMKLFRRKAFKKFEEEWQDSDQQLKMIPGKEALSFVNAVFQQEAQIAITPTGIIDAMRSSEVPGDLTNLIKRLDKFANIAEASD